MTTRADALKALGPPSSVYEAANGEKTLSWARDGGHVDRALNEPTLFPVEIRGNPRLSAAILKAQP